LKLGYTNLLDAPVTNRERFVSPVLSGSVNGEELVFRLFFISFWVWMISYLHPKGRSSAAVYWTVAVETGFLSLAAAHHFKRAGSLAAAGVILDRCGVARPVRIDTAFQVFTDTSQGF
jgi:hypothetical protein